MYEPLFEVFKEQAIYFIFLVNYKYNRPCVYVTLALLQFPRRDYSALMPTCQVLLNFHFMLPNNIDAAQWLNRIDCVTAASLRFRVNKPRFDVGDTHFWL